MRLYNYGDELRRRRNAEQRNVKSGVISLCVEWSLHQRVWNHSNDSAPWLWLRGIIDPNAAAEWAFITPIFLRKTRAYDCNRLFCIGVIDREIAPFENSQADSCEIAIRNE